MSERQSAAMREVREAACALSAACMARLDLSLLGQEQTVSLLPKAPEDFAELLRGIK
jgi:hypothetical protein